MSESFAAIESSLQEARLFPPPPEFARHAHIKSRDEYERLYRESLERPEVEQGAGLETAVRQVVRRREDQRVLRLSRRPD